MKKPLSLLLALCSALLVTLTGCGPDCDPGEVEQWIPCGDREPPVCGHWECVEQPSAPKDTADNGA